MEGSQPHRCTWNCLPKAPLMKTWLKLWSPGGRPSSFFQRIRREARWGIGSQFRSIRKRENGSESRPHCSMERSRVTDAREFRTTLACRRDTDDFNELESELNKYGLAEKWKNQISFLKNLFSVKPDEINNSNVEPIYIGFMKATGGITLLNSELLNKKCEELFSDLVYPSTKIKKPLT